MSSRNPGFDPGYPGSYHNENIFIGSRIMAFGHFRDDNFYAIRDTRHAIRR